MRDALASAHAEYVARRRDRVGVYGIAGMSDHSIVSASLRSTAALRARSPAILDRLDAMRKREP
jgi:hypothetical protein